MKPFHEQFKDRIDLTDRTVVVTEGAYEKFRAALDEAKALIRLIGTTGCETGSNIRRAEAWMKKYYPDEA